LVAEVLLAQLDKAAQQVAEQVVVTQYFPLLHLLAVVVVVLALVKMENQAVLVVALVTKLLLAALEIHHLHHQVKATTVEMRLLGAMAVVAVEAHLPLVQCRHLRLLVVLAVLVQRQASVALQ
jgi:hypothetical protein